MLHAQSQFLDLLPHAPPALQPPYRSQLAEIYHCENDPRQGGEFGDLPEQPPLHLDLSSAADVKELHDVIDFEQTVLVSGSPPCTISSLQQRPADLKKQDDFCTSQSAPTGSSKMQDATLCTDIQQVVLLGTRWRSTKCSQNQVYSQSFLQCAATTRDFQDQTNNKPIKWLTNFPNWRKLPTYAMRSRQDKLVIDMPFSSEV